MLSQGNTWSLILAAGSGVRLRNLTTTPSGTVIPKQFWCLRGGPSLLDLALERAHVVSANCHTCAIVAEQHRRWWEPALWCLPAANVIVQPENRGTANGILLPLLHILERDPAARLVVLPSDHHVRQEAVLARALRHAVEQWRWHFDETVLLGLQPEQPDPGLGYILPGRADGRGALEVLQFIEKPTAAQAHELIEHGGLWNAFIVVASAQALLALFRQRVPGIVGEMSAALQCDLSAHADGPAVAELYDRLPSLDFSRDILQGQECWLRALPVPQCGWSDLGTPERVSEALRRMPAAETESIGSIGSGYMSLAARSELLNRVASLA
ncbi:MAG: sugar phosphate nucleotidyltransferase [Steroidobacterales bacterium]